MAATKVMQFWAVCLAVLGKLLASLGVSAPASAARREAALYERTLGNGSAGTDAPGGEVPKGVPCAEPDRDPDAGTPAVPTARAVPRVPAPRAVPQVDHAWPTRRTVARPELPPTIKQRIRAEAHGSSPGLRSRVTRGLEPLMGAPVPHDAAPHTPAPRDGAQEYAAPRNATDTDARPAAVPAARRRVDTARTV
ncbi:DUF6344 domain-containing protein [Streptomyces lydicus]|uniref:Uncharacterized protein n=1 Tax=Streptomyces lydicus TaxID=47763 RepID=A0A1D7VDX0_9ACTN|nr:DUF6344 domain-containing protein [Streptomyces lydicus]AOP44955.1 hypothetical protein SL103_00635 [Streptomyces lydicus]